MARVTAVAALFAVVVSTGLTLRAQPRQPGRREEPGVFGMRPAVAARSGHAVRPALGPTTIYQAAGGPAQTPQP